MTKYEPVKNDRPMYIKIAEWCLGSTSECQRIFKVDQYWKMTTQKFKNELIVYEEQIVL